MNRTRRLYERYHFGDFSYGTKRDEYNRPLTEFLQTIAADAAVFDVGCGTGYWMEAAMRYGARPGQIFGIDVAVSSVAALKGKGLKGFAGSSCALALSDDVSDITICNGVIHHTLDPFQSFQELVRITKPGGRIFLGVYCRWNPYFYLIHRAAWPIRYMYWNWSERILDPFWPVARCVITAAARLFTGARLSEKTAKTLLMDQLITPYARLFSKRTLKRYAARCHCEMTQCRLSKGGLMWAAVFKVNGRAQGGVAQSSSQPARSTQEAERGSGAP